MLLSTQESGTAKVSSGTMTGRKWLSEWIKSNESQIKDFKLTLHLLRKSPLAMLGIFIITGYLLISIIYPWIVPFPEDIKGATHPDKLLPPSSVHFFGTDEMGRDVFSRTLSGTRLSLLIALTVISIASLIGTPLGLISGYKKGKIAHLIMILTNVFLSIPSILMALAVNAALGSGIVNSMIAMGVSWWPYYTRLIRGQVLSIRENLYVEAARSMGAGDARIIFRHILPNCTSTLIVQITSQVGYAILMAGTLGFLGLGAVSPTPEWGLMISLGRIYVPDWWWIATFPGLGIFFAVLGFTLLGDALRDVLDPRLRR